MNEREFERLKYIETTKNLVGINDLTNRSARTLLLGYDKEGYTWHTYIRWNQDDPEIITVTYLSTTKADEVSVVVNEDYIPNKRLYPHACDMEFCELLTRAGVFLPFTAPEWYRNDGRAYYGKLDGSWV